MIYRYPKSSVHHIKLLSTILSFLQIYHLPSAVTEFTPKSDKIVQTGTIQVLNGYNRTNFYTLDTSYREARRSGKDLILKN